LSSAFEICESLSAAPAEVIGAAHLCDARSDLVRRYEAYRAPLRFHVTASGNRCDAYAVSPGMVMAVVDVGCTQAFESRLSGQDIVEFHYRMSGSIVLEGSWGELCIREPSCLVWYQPTGCDDAAERLGTRSQVRETWVSLYCDRNWLYRVVGIDAAELLTARAPDGMATPVPKFRTTSGIWAMGALLKDIMQTPQSGTAHWLMTIARAHELLHVTLRDAYLLDRDEQDNGRLSDRDRRRIGHARDILAEEFTSPPSLPELGRRAGINTSRLCAGFKLLFGETTSGFVRRQRLEFARTLLTSSDLQVREIARRAGYAHHGTFTAAFTRHFGAAPKALRRSVRTLPRSLGVKA
jgi:AraC-like DNA-binding protein